MKQHYTLLALTTPPEPLPSPWPSTSLSPGAQGGGFTLLCDDLARGLVGGEIPLGILTSLLGAAAFLLLLSSAPKT